MSINFGAVPKAINANNRSGHFLSGLIHNPFSEEARKDRKWEQRLAVATQVQEDKELRRHQRQKDIVDYRHKSRIKHNRIENAVRRVEKRNEAQDAADIKLKLHEDMGDVDVANHGRRNQQDIKAAKKISKAKEVGKAKGKAKGEQILLANQQQLQPQKHALDDADLQHKLDNDERAHLHREDLKDQAATGARTRQGQDFQQKLAQTRQLDQQKIRATKSGARAKIVGQAEGERRAVQIQQQMLPTRLKMEDDRLQNELDNATLRDMYAEDRKNERTANDIQRKRDTTRADIQNNWDMIHSGLKKGTPGSIMFDWVQKPTGTVWNPPAPQQAPPTRQSNVKQTTTPDPQTTQPAPNQPTTDPHAAGNGTSGPKPRKPRQKKTDTSGTGAPTPQPAQQQPAPEPAAVKPAHDPHASGNGTASPAPEPTVNQGRQSEPEATVADNPHASGNGEAPPKRPAAPRRKSQAVKVQPSMGLQTMSTTPIQQKGKAWAGADTAPYTRALVNPDEVPHPNHDPRGYSLYAMNNPGWREINSVERNSLYKIRDQRKEGTYNSQHSQRAWSDILAEHEQKTAPKTQKKP